MLHRCIEGERVGDDGGKVVGVDRRHDDGPGGVPAPPGERGREPPPSSSSLSFPLEESPSEIGSLSLFPSVSAFQILAFHRFLNSRRSVTLIGLKF